MNQVTTSFETDFDIGPQAIAAYSRLNYTMWHALGEFIDNSTQSRKNYDGVITAVLKEENTPLLVEILYDRVNRLLTISDNSIGMNRDRLVNALKIAVPTIDSKGRSRFGMGMKTAACWIGKRWKVVTCEWASGLELTAEVDVKGIAYDGKKIPISAQHVGTNDHYTKIVISDLNRNIQARTEETIKSYLGSMYQFDIERGDLKITFNGEEIKAPTAMEFDTDPDGKPMKLVLPPFTTHGKTVTGWIGVLKKGGRKYGGFSLFQNERQIQGYPSAWKPRSIFGGVDDEGANNLISQRLTGVLNLDEHFHVSHTKDAISFEGDEEEELETFLKNTSEDYRNFAKKPHGKREQPWSQEKIRDLVESMKEEFTSPEMKDAYTNTLIPPLDLIVANNNKQIESLTEEDRVATLEVVDGLKIVVSYSSVSENDPHLTIQAGADAGTMHVIINGLHPYYVSIESPEAINECVRQFIYDAMAEYRTSKMKAPVNPNSVRRFKNDLMRAEALHIENKAAQDAAKA